MTANAVALDKELMKEMVRRLERELNREFGCFGQTEGPCPATAVAELPAKRVPEAATDLRALELGNNIFNRSFVEVMEESATKVKAAEALRTRVQEATPVSA